MTGSMKRASMNTPWASASAKAFRRASMSLGSTVTRSSEPRKVARYFT